MAAISIHSHILKGFTLITTALARKLFKHTYSYISVIIQGIEKKKGNNLLAAKYYYACTSFVFISLYISNQPIKVFYPNCDIDMNTVCLT